MHPESLQATETAQEVMPGDPAHLYGVKPDASTTDTDLDKATTETVGHMHDPQGLAPTSHNSGDLSYVGPVDHGAMPGNHNSDDIFGGGFGRES